MRWFPIKTGLLASLVVLSLSIPANASLADPLQRVSATSLTCTKTYSRATAHRLFRAVYRNPTRVSRHEKRTIRRVIRCQRSKRSKRIIRRHHARYRRHHRVAPPGNRGIAYVMLYRRGQLAQWPCLNSLWTKESGWSTTADNPNSDAYGIPQALPGSKMSTHGADWATNPVTQIRWGLSYLAGRYGGPCGGWGHFQTHGWY